MHYKQVLLSTLLIMMTQPLIAADLDCNQVTDEVEKMICDPENFLRADHKQLNDLYTQLLKISSPLQKDILIDEQENWLNQQIFCLKEEVSSPAGCLAKMYDEQLAHLFVLFLQNLVSNDKRDLLAQVIAFPIHVYLKDKRFKINDKQQFLTHYTAIMNNRVKSAVLNQQPTVLFSNWRGKMIGNGEVWFEGTKIIAINNHWGDIQTAEEKHFIEEKHEIDKWTETCLVKNYTMTEKVECFNQASAKWHDELNTSYQALMTQLNPKEKQEVENAQQAWNNYKKAEFDLINTFYGALDGTLWLPIKAKAGVNVLKKRALQLQGYLTDRHVGGDTESIMSVASESNNPCDATGFVIDNDPNGLNVRSAPKGNIISRIPHNDYDSFTQVHIVASEEGWLQISGWEDFFVSVTFDEKAWIYGRLVGTFVRGYEEGGVEAYAESSNDAEKMGQFLANHVVKVIDCKKDWLFVSGQSVDGRRIEAWLAPEEQCSNALTTCL